MSEIIRYKGVVTCRTCLSSSSEKGNEDCVIAYFNNTFHAGCKCCDTWITGDSYKDIEDTGLFFLYNKKVTCTPPRQRPDS